MRKLLAACSGCLMVAAVSTALLSAGPARAQDAEAGKRVFNQCRACHVVDQETNRVGPHLVGLIGRKSGWRRWLRLALIVMPLLRRTQQGTGRRSPLR